MNQQIVPKIEIRDVVKSFGSTLALDHLNLRVWDSEIVCLLGPSGCGKSTALDIVAGFERPSSGTVLVDGQTVEDTGPERSVIFQTSALFPWMNVWNNLVLGPKSRGKKGYEDRAHELLRIVGLVGFESHFPYQLSGGMKQRASIARALLSEPDVLLMDEPFGALDAQTRLTMQELLLEVSANFSPTVLFITHDVDEAIFLGDRVVVLSPRPGRIAHEVDVDFGGPRSFETLTTPEFNSLKRQVFQMTHDRLAS